MQIIRAAIMDCMTRNEKLLAHIDIARHRGLEFGALCDPVVPTDCQGISYVDHLDTTKLREKYANDPNVNIERIVSVQYVWDGGPLVDIVGARSIDYVVASHMAEHVPDLIGWLKYVADILRPGGLLALAVPDMRYSFDCQRNLTNIADLIQAHFEQYRRPSIRQVLDHFVHKVDVPEQCSIASLWQDANRSTIVARSHPFLLKELGEAGLRKHFDNIQGGEYIDAHCSVFTPASFIQCLKELALLDMTSFTVKSFHPTVLNEQEFFITLEKLPDSVALESSKAERLRYVLERLPTLPIYRDAETEN